MARSIAEIVEEDRWDAERDLARTQVRAAYSLASVCEAWGQMILSLEDVAEHARVGAA
jgi:hypothetical protein